jgi:hypothetical protein
VSWLVLTVGDFGNQFTPEWTRFHAALFTCAAM